MHTPPPAPPRRTLTLASPHCPFLLGFAASHPAPPEGAHHSRTLRPKLASAPSWSPRPLPPPPPTTRQPSGRPIHTLEHRRSGPRRPAPGTFPGRGDPAVWGPRAPVPVPDPRTSPDSRLASPGAPGTLDPAVVRAAVLTGNPVRLPSGPDRGSRGARLLGATRRVLLWGGRRGGPLRVVRRASRNYSLTGFLSFIKTQSCGDVTSPAAPRPGSGLWAPEPRPAPLRPRPGVLSLY